MKKLFPNLTLAGVAIGLINLTVVAFVAFIATTILSALAAWSVTVFNFLN